MQETKKWLESLVNRINKDEKARDALGKWIGRYYGKILEWHVGDGKFFITLTKDGAKLAEGEYPSPEVVLTMDGGAWAEMTEKNYSFELVKDWMKTGKLAVRGNLNEVYNFSKFLEAIKK